MFKIGEKVVCIHAIDEISKNEIYEIAQIISREGFYGFVLKGLETNDLQGRIAFFEWRFRN